METGIGKVLVFIQPKLEKLEAFSILDANI